MNLDPPVNIKLHQGIVEVEGLKISLWALKNLRNPPQDALFSFKVVDDQIQVTRYATADEAAKFFAKA